MGFSGYGEYIAKDKFPPSFQQLEAMQIETILCSYKKELSAAYIKNSK